MLIGFLGLILVALWANIGYYEWMYKKPVKKDKDLIPAFVDISRKRKKRYIHDTFNGNGGSRGKPGLGDSDDFNSR